MQSAEKLKPLARMAGKKIGKMIIRLLGPYLPFLLILAVIFLFVLFIVGTVFSSTPQGGLFTGPTKTKEDSRLEEFYKKIADKNNKRDKWLVSGESSLESTWFDTINTDMLLSDNKVLTEKDIKNLVKVDDDYTHYYEFEYSPVLNDYYGKDRDLIENFGEIHSASVFHMLTYQKDKTSDEFKENTGADFRPYLYYKNSTITIVTVTETEEGSETDTTIIPIYLLVESNSLREHTIYSYEWETTTTSSAKSTTTITKEVLLGQTQINTPWQRLDDWVKEKYQLKAEEILTARNCVWEAGIGYTTFTERLEWLFSGNVRRFLITESFIPPELMAHFSRASEAFGIPSWFLAALAYQESSFNPAAINKTGAYGLFQLMPAEQKSTVDELIANYSHLLPDTFITLYNTSSKDASFYQQAVGDPWINTLGGCLVFMGKAKGIEINWETPAWKKQVLPILAAYGGYSYIPQNLWAKYGVSNEQESREKVLNWCKDEYASKIYNLAEKFQVIRILPIDGISLTADITSFFGYRTHPVTGKYQYHDGIDIAAPTGTPVKAVTNASVSFAGYKDSISGNAVIISNGRYVFSYCHLSKVLTTAGEDVVSGQILGEVGSTGRSTGPHLHFGIRDAVNNCLIDPLVWLTTSM